MPLPDADRELIRLWSLAWRHTGIRDQKVFEATGLHHTQAAQRLNRLIDTRDALEAMPVSDEALLEQALAVGRRRASQLGDLPRGVRRRRLLAFLSRRGFSGTALAESVRRLMRDGEGGNDGDGGMDGEDG